MMDRLSVDDGPDYRVAAGWVVAGLLLIALMGVSFSDEPAAASGEADAAIPADTPTYAIDEDLAPLSAG